MPDSYSVALSAGWNTFKSRPGFFIGAYLLAMLCVSVPYGFAVGFSAHDDNGIAFLFNIVTFVVSGVISIGIVTIGLAAIDHKPLSIGMVFGTKRLGNYLLATILFDIMVFFGGIALVIPGLIFMVKFMFYPYLIVEKDMGPIAALGASWRLTKGRFFDVLALFVIAVVIAFLAAIPVFLGWLVAMPVIMLASASMYRILGTAPAPTPAPAA